MNYSNIAKNSGKDLIYQTRLKLIYSKNIDYKKSSKMYAYFMAAYLGINLL